MKEASTCRKSEIRYLIFSPHFSLTFPFDAVIFPIEVLPAPKGFTAEHAENAEKKVNQKSPRPLETVSQSRFVIASDRRERGNLIIFKALSDCFGRFSPSQ